MAAISSAPRSGLPNSSRARSSSSSIKIAITDHKTYPIMMQRTGYNVAPYGSDQFRATLGPSELFAREKFIFVYQDIRGRYMSEGDYVVIRPHKPVKTGPKDTDESTDTYDTIDWLIHNV